MEKNFIQLDQSGWWILLIIVLSVGLTWFLYSIRKTSWSKTQNRILAGIRFVGILFALLLLLEPFINQTVTDSEKPIVALAIDNSESVVSRSIDSSTFKNQINRLINDLEEEDIEVQTFYIGDDDSLNFDQPKTDIFKLQQKVESALEGRNWVSTILLSDGIYNSGSSPIYKPYPVPQFTVGLGDTIPPKDINISRVLYNKVSFKDSETPIKVEITQKGYDGQQIELNLMEKGDILSKKTVLLDKNIQEVEFIIKSEVEGLRRLEVRTALKENEFVAENNRSGVFMEVVDGRQKVLIVAQAPHPDIKAIRSALATTENYETDVYISAINDEIPTDIYDVVIHHGAFVTRSNYQQKENPGVWYILNERSSLQQFNKAIPFFNIEKRGAQSDLVTGSFNQSFSKFKIPEDQLIFEDFPPISVPFGDYTLSGPSEVLLFQKVGSVTTRKPLFAFYDDGTQKSAVLAGQNIWKWKLQEAAINGNSIQFNEIVLKTIQFLSVKNDKQQFRFKSRGNNFSDLEAVVFDSEVYNDIYERTYGNKISLRVTGEEGETQDFEFTDSEFNSSFKVPALKTGIYTYSATAKLGEKTLQDRGQFLVSEVNKEYLNLTADHNLLKTLALKTEGEYIHYSNFDQIKDRILARDFKNLLRSSESYFPLIQNTWMLLIILLLFSSEWALRKYWGGY